ncbi:hypothetical protein ACCF52_000490 [Vibrio parahaemolyticus]
MYRIRHKTAKCTICQSKIALNAKKCVHCGCYQDFRRYIDVGNTSLSLLVALFTLIILASKEIFSIYESYIVSRQEPEIISTIASISDRELNVIYTNNGKSKGILPNGSLCLIPVAKIDSDYYRDVELEPAIGTNLRSVSYDEIERINMSVYLTDLPQSKMVLLPGQTIIVSYKLHQRRDLINQEVSNEFRGYCNLSVSNIYGENQFGGISVLDNGSILLMQSILRERPEYTPTNS